MLQSPVAEGNQDIVELQALTLVYGENTYAVGFAALDGFAADGFFPFIDKSVNICGIVLCKPVQLVVEGADIGTLFVKSFQFKDSIEPFCQLVEWQLKQLLCVLHKGFR